MTDQPRYDAVIVGGGVAGLAAARRLRDAGRSVVVLEASDRVGGRITTDEVDGFLVDRGFQVLNPAYPSLRRLVRLDRLGLRPFPRAVRVRTHRGLVELADPTRRPLTLPSMLGSGLVTPRDVAALRALVRSGVRDETRREAFDRAGFTGPLRRQVVDPFLAGVVCERDGSTSARFTTWLLGLFALGTPGLPSGGMRTLPRVLAEGLDVRLDTPVLGIDPERGVVRTDAGAVEAASIVLAAGPRATATLSGRAPAPTHHTRTLWFATDQAPSDTAAIHVDGRGPLGPVTTTSVVSLVAPEYAPAGRHLVAALAVAGDGIDLSEDAVREHCAAIYGVDTAPWRLVATHDLPETLPVVAPGAAHAPLFRRQGRAALCGDQYGNASTEGALRSGIQAAEALLLPSV